MTIFRFCRKDNIQIKKCAFDGDVIKKEMN